MVKHDCKLEITMTTYLYILESTEHVRKVQGYTLARIKGRAVDLRRPAARLLSGAFLIARQIGSQPILSDLIVEYMKTDNRGCGEMRCDM